MFYVWVTYSIFIFLLTSEFHRASVTLSAWNSVYHPCPTLTCRATVVWPAQIWMLGSCISCCLINMILLTAFAIDVAAAVGAFCISNFTSEMLAWSKTSSMLSNFPSFGVNSMISDLGPIRSPLQANWYQILLYCGCHSTALQFGSIRWV